MKAIVQHRYGSPDALELQEVDTPEPRDGEVLLRVHASSVNQADWIALTGKPYAARHGIKVNWGVSTEPSL